MNTSRILLIHPDSLETHELVDSLYKAKQELSTLKAPTKDEKTNFYAAKIIRNEIKGMTDKMNWSPSYTDLTAEKVDIGIYLPTFLNDVLSDKLAEIDSTRLYRIKMSLGQDLVYNVSNRRISTPKSVLFPYNIKMLTNNTELINMVNRLGHGICYSLLEKIKTEDAYKVIDQQTDGIIVPKRCKENTFTVSVADNIDCQEETLRGMYL